MREPQFPESEGQQTQTTASPTDPLYYVGIGASAGGLEALDVFFSHMPPDSGMAFVVIQHLSPDYKSLMVELLSKRTTMPVLRAEEGLRVEPNSVYLIPPRKQLSVFHGKLLLRDFDPNQGINLPIDVFLMSLAEDQGDKAIAVILSGTGSDGVRGVRAVKEAGGMVTVQSEASAKFDGMPRAAISTGLADIVLPPEEMPGRLVSFAVRRTGAPADRPKALLSDEDGLTRIFALLREQTKVDFTFYKSSTVLRRIERRITVNQAKDLREYVRMLEARPEELTTLYRELLIGVTSFFRDREVFEVLGKTYLPALLNELNHAEARFWVPGCSTGEEAYTFAILARECQDRMKNPPNIKIFATDLDRNAVMSAGNGFYPESITADLPSGLLTKYFVHRDDGYQIHRSIREMVVFAQHNLIKDPPFTSIDLISCRNLLIYLQPVLQKKIIDYLNFSLHPGGLLLLGTSETPGDQGELFEPLHHKFKIYRARGRRRPLTDAVRVPAFRTSVAPAAYSRLQPGARILGEREEERLQENLLQMLADDFNIFAAVVNERLELLHVVGNTDGLLRFPPGRVQNEITRVVSKELAIPLSTGLQKAFHGGGEVRYKNVRLESSEGGRIVEIRIRLLPHRKGQERNAMILLQDGTPHQKVTPSASVNEFDLSKEAEQRIYDLEQDLQFTKENLQATIEELETSNEELQATNEELLAGNEELQSTNEELQSVNEELHTVNAEYQSKIIELTETTNDLDNLMSTTRIATLFLDENLDIRRFTPELRNVYRIKESDLNRPLSHLSHTLIDIDPVVAARQVIDTGKALETECRTDSGHWLLMRVLPYRIGESESSGVVITFTDVGPLKRFEESLRLERAQLLSIFDSIDEIIYVSDMNNYEVLFANKAAKNAFGKDIVGAVCFKALQKRLSPCEFCTNEIIRKDSLRPYRWEFHNPVTRADYDITDRAIQWPDGRLVRFELAIDVTQRKQTETSLRRITELLNTAQRLARIGGWEWTIGTSTMYWSDEVYRIHGLDPHAIQPGSKEHIEHSLDCYVPGDRERVQKAFEACCEIGEPYDLECDFVDFSGRTKRVRTRAEAVSENERVLKVIGIIMDVTSTKLDSLTS